MAQFIARSRISAHGQMHEKGTVLTLTAKQAMGMTDAVEPVIRKAEDVQPGPVQIDQRNARSKQSLLWQREAERTREHVRQTIAHIDSERSRVQDERDRLLRGSLKGDQRYLAELRSCDEDLESCRVELALLEEQNAALGTEIEKLFPNPKQAKARAQRQESLAQLAAERLEKDREIEKAVESLRAMLGGRTELTTRMMECTSAVDFTLEADGLDTQRFDDLLAALPENLSTKSEHWTGWFLGEQGDAKPYVVRDEILVIPETLASHGVYCRGERIELTDEEARQFLRDKRPGLNPEKPHRLRMPSIVTLEAFEAAAATGAHVEDVWLHEDFARIRDEDSSSRSAFAR